MFIMMIRARAPMPEFGALMERLLELRPDMSRAKVEELIQDKKNKIGAGYLTDNGAMFLIAGDLGISISEPAKAEVGLKELWTGAREVSVEAKVMSISPAKQYSRKDGTAFFLRTMIVYDADARAAVKMWDEKANLPGMDELKPGDVVKITNAYVKQDMDGAPAINVGSGSSVEAVAGEGAGSGMPGIDEITKDVGEIGEEGKNLAVSGILDGPIDTMQYVNSKGMPGKALKMRMKGKDGRSVRVVLWGKDEAGLPPIIASDSKARLLGVRAKPDDQGAMEIHGNESTAMSVEGSREPEPIRARIVSAARSDSGETRILGADAKGNLLRFTDPAGKMLGYPEGEVIEFLPARAHGNLITLDANSYVRKVEEGEGGEKIPKKEELRTMISSITTAGGSYCVDVIVLKSPERREVQTRGGETVYLGEVLVGDATGQMWVKGWREDARLIDGLGTGDIAVMTDVTARSGLEGRVDLFVGPYTKVTKKDTGSAEGGGGLGAEGGGAEAPS